MKLRFVVPFLLAALPSFQRHALAATPPPDPAGQKAPLSPSGAPALAANVGEARVHYERALQLFDEENYDVAAFEFQRAYELAPNYRILYNMAKLQRVRNDYASALRNFQRYLSDGGSELSKGRRAEVKNEVDSLLARVATVTVAVNEASATVFVDGEPICGPASVECSGTSPLAAPLIVNPGRRTISAQKKGFVTATRTFVVVGSDRVNVELTLENAIAPTLAVDPGPRNRAIVAWSATGAFGVAAVMSVFLHWGRMTS